MKEREKMIFDKKMYDGKGKIGKKIGQYLISKNVPILDYYSHTF